ncbi:putative ribonuclease H-like domain-containing protein [Tanacetum coccineum]
MSIDDLYNNFKIVEQSVKKSVGASSGAQNLAFITTLSTSSTNDVNTTKPAYEVSTVSPNVNTASPQVSTASFSDNVVYAFMVENPNGSNLLHRDIEQIHEDDLEVMDLKWQLSLLSMRVKRYFQRTYKKIFINANDTAGYDKSKSDMAEEQVQTNKALMAFSDSELNQTEFTVTTYKRGLEIVEEQLITYRKNEVLFSEEVAVLKREVSCKDYEINVLKSEFEKVKKEKEGIEFKIEQFDKASKDLDKLLESQITNKSKKGLGYSVVPLPHPLIYNRPKKLDQSYSGLDEIKELEFKGYGSQDSKKYSNVVCDKKPDDSKENSDNSLVKEQVSKDTSSFVESSLNVDKETVFPVDKKVEYVKPKNHEKPIKKSVRFTHKVNTAKAQAVNTARPQAVNTARPKTVKTARPNSVVVNVVRVNQANAGKPQQDDTGFVDSGCSRHMTGNIAYLSDFKEFDRGYVTFGGGAHGGRISGKGTLKTDSLDFEDLPDENQILLKIPRKDNMYSFDMKNIVPKESLTCLVAKATSDESMLWHRRLGHINFKNINKLVKDNLVRGLPTKRFENDQTCVACLKGKQHRASCKSKVLNPITKPLFMLHMDLFGLTFVSSLMHKKYCLVVTDDYSRFTWVFFLTTKDETSEILKNFIKEIENLVDKKVKIIRSDNGIEFKNKQNGVAERRNRTLIEAARTMLADSKLPTTFWAEAVSTACYVQNRVLVVKPHNKTPYELFRGFKPALSFMKPFGCHVTILNTLDSLGKFDGKSDEGTITNESADASYFDSPTQDVDNGEPKSTTDDQKQDGDGLDNENDEQDKSDDVSSPKEVNDVGQHVNTSSPDVNTGSFKLNVVSPSVNTASSYDQDSPKDMFTMGASHTLEATHIEFFSDEDKPGVDLGNITNSYIVPTTPNTRIHKDHPIENVIGDVKSSVQTRRMTKPTFEQGLLSAEYEQKTHDTLNTYLYACFLSQIEPTSIAKALSDSYWVEAMQEELLQFKLQQGHRQEEGIDYEEVFAPVARIEAIRLFLAYASFMGFLVYQMDVKSDFLYRTIEEEVYVTQPPGFKDPDHPDKVYKVVKALYGLHQAPKHVDLEKPLVKDGDANDVYVYLYRSMIGSLMYLTTSRPDIMFACKKQTVVDTFTTEAEYVAAASYCGQVLWIQNQLLDYGYSFMNTMIHIDNNSTICIIENLVQHSKTKPIEIRHHFIRDCNAKKLIQMVKIDTKHNVADLLTKGFDAGRVRHVKRGRDTKIPQSSGPPVKVGDEAIHKELGDSMERAATTASSLEVEQDSGNINRTQSMATLNDPSP